MILLGSFAKATFDDKMKINFEKIKKILKQDILIYSNYKSFIILTGLLKSIQEMMLLIYTNNDYVKENIFLSIGAL